MRTRQNPRTPCKKISGRRKVGGSISKLLKEDDSGNGYFHSPVMVSSPFSEAEAQAEHKWRRGKLKLMLAVTLHALPTCVTVEGSVYLYFN